MTDPDLVSRVGDLVLASPVMTAAGCAGTGRELEPFTDLATMGAFTTRTITLDAHPGAAGPRLLPTPAGVLSHTGGHNPGLQAFLATELPWLAQRGVRTVVSIAGTTLGEYGEIAGRLASGPGVSALEVNLAGWPDPYQGGKVLQVVRREVPQGVAVHAKLTPAGAYVEAARALAHNGADALVLAHGFPGILFDPETLRPALGGVRGDLSGPAVLAQALRCVWEVHAALPEVPIVGVGGIRSGFDALQMLLAGAQAVQVGTALVGDPGAVARITEELRGELGRRGVGGPGDLVGLGHAATTHGGAHG